MNYTATLTSTRCRLIWKELKRSALKHNLLTIRHWKLVNQYRRDYINFKEKYLHTTERQFRNHKELESLDGKYDVIIAGGDQVWNVLCPDSSNVELENELPLPVPWYLPGSGKCKVPNF